MNSEPAVVEQGSEGLQRASAIRGGADANRALRFGALALAVLGAVLLWRFWTYDPPSPHGYDERIYSMWAQQMAEGGLETFRRGVASFPTDPSLSLGPPPTRLSWLTAAAVAGSLLGGHGVAELALFSAACGFACLIVWALLLRRWMAPALVPWALALAGTAPLATALSRRALQETFVTLFLFLALWFVDRWATDRRRSDFLLAGLMLVIACLAKETIYFLLPVVVLLGGVRARERRLQAMLWLGGLCAAAVAVAVSTLVWAFGGLDMFTAVLRRIGEMPQAIDYARNYQVGAWYRYLVDLLLLAPLAAPLALLALAPPGPSGGRASGTNAMLLLLLLGCAILTLSPTLNVRQVLFAEFCVQSLAVVALAQLVSWSVRPGLASRVALSAGALVLLAINVAQFHRYFWAGNIYDPVTDELVQASRLTPDR